MRAKSKILVFSVASVILVTAASATQVFRCDNEYTNDVARAQQLNCQPLVSDNVTIVHGNKKYVSRRGKPAAKSKGSSAAGGGYKVAAATQQERDAQAKLILQQELTQTQTRLQQLLQLYNGGKPKRLANETDTAAYAQRVQELYKDIVRHQEDIKSLQKEIARFK